LGSMRTGVTGVAISSLIAIAAGGCVGSGAKLTVPGDPTSSGHVSTEDTSPGRPYSYLTAPVCTATAESVEITSVELSGGGGLKLTRFATRPDSPPRLGAARGPLEQLGFDTTGPVKVSTQCYPGAATDHYDTSTYLTALAIELQRISSGTGSYDTLTIHYTDGEHERSVAMLFGVTLCAKGDRTAPDCSA
jgi:hypothetical protein